MLFHSLTSLLLHKSFAGADSSALKQDAHEIFDVGIYVWHPVRQHNGESVEICEQLCHCNFSKAFSIESCKTNMKFSVVRRTLHCGIQLAILQDSGLHITQLMQPSLIVFMIVPHCSIIPEALLSIIFHGC